jgi:hypothetical protein
MSWGEDPPPNAGGQGGPDGGQPPPPPPGQALPDNRLRQMDLGDVLDGTFRLVRTHWRAFVLGLGAVTVIPAVLFFVLLGLWAWRFATRTQNLFETTPITDSDLSGLAAFGPAFAEMGAVLLVMVLGMLLVVPLIYGVPVHIAAVGFRTGHVTAMDGIRAAGRRYWALLGTLVLLGLIIFGIVLAITIPLAVVAGVGVNTDAGGALFGVLILGYIVAWVAAVVVSVRLSLAIPAVMVEQAGPVEALQRSNALVRGKSLMVFATFLVIGIIAGIAVVVVMFGSTALINVATTAISAAVDNSAVRVIGAFIALVVMMLAYLMQYALMASTMVLVYFDRRVRTDGLDLTELANELGVRDAPQW